MKVIIKSLIKCHLNNKNSGIVLYRIPSPFLLLSSFSSSPSSSSPAPPPLPLLPLLLLLHNHHYKRMLQSTSIEITDDQIDILLDRLDTDGDGEIDFR